MKLNRSELISIIAALRGTIHEIIPDVPDNSRRADAEETLKVTANCTNEKFESWHNVKEKLKSNKGL